MSDTRDAARAAYTMKEFCSAFGISRTRAFAEVRAGRIKARKLGNYYLVRRDDALAWLDSLPEARSERAA